MKKFFPGLLMIFAFAGYALGCARAETGVPVCASFTRADVVFFGKAIKVENAGGKDELPEGARKIRFQVLENFKGADNPTFTLITSDRTGTCGVNIKQGQSWIIYAGLDQIYKFFSASRALKIEGKEKNEELATLKLAAAGKNETMFSGRFASALQKYNDEEIEIMLEGGEIRRSAKTDADGAFSFAPLAEGKYRVRIKFPYRASLEWDEYLLKTAFTEGAISVFDYEIELREGDCLFNFFDVRKINK